MLKLINTETGAIVTEGSMLRPVHGGQAWRLEAVHQDRLHVSQSHHQLGRVHKEFHPRVFGLHVEVDVKVWQDRAELIAWIKRQLIGLAGLFVGGFIAWWVAEILGHLG